MFKAVRKKWVHISLAAWIIACAAVLWPLWTYANRAGAQGYLPAGWTPPPEFDPPVDRAMLLMFAHPKCPCTRATMSALERLQCDEPGTFATRVVFYEPIDADPSWRQTDLWARAGRLVDARTIADPGGSITASAGAVISGCTALIDQDGALLFWGGITPSRGHEGESVGLTALRSILRGHEPGCHRSPVYGCEIVGSSKHPSGCCDRGGCDASGDV